MKGISALIFSMNEYKLVKKQIKLLYPYVDEIVIIDSSTDKNQKRLMKNLEKKYKKVRVIWLPPLGIVEFFYKVGMKECKYEWILMLDADELPNEKLLKNLKKLIQKPFDGYKIFREEKGLSLMFMIKFFRKSKFFPTGLIHSHGTLLSQNIKKLDKQYKIVHTRSGLPLLEGKKRADKYFFVEKYQIGYRMLLYTDNRVTFWFYDEFQQTSRKIIDKAKIIRNFFLRFFGKVGFFIILFSFIFFQEFVKASLFGVKTLLNLKWLKYSILLSKEVLKNYNKLFPLWIAFYKEGFYRTLKLDSKKELLRLSKKLNFGNDGINNFLKLVNYAYRNKILPNFKYYNTVTDITSF